MDFLHLIGYEFSTMVIVVAMHPVQVIYRDSSFFPLWEDSSIMESDWNININSLNANMLLHAIFIKRWYCIEFIMRTCVSVLDHFNLLSPMSCACVSKCVRISLNGYWQAICNKIDIHFSNITLPESISCICSLRVSILLLYLFDLFLSHTNTTKNGNWHRQSQMSLMADNERRYLCIVAAVFGIATKECCLKCKLTEHFMEL